MPTDYSPSNSRRPSRRGGRRPERGDNSNSSTRREPQPVKKKTFLEKIVGFLTGDNTPKQASPRSRERGEEAAPRTRERSARPERSERSSEPSSERSSDRSARPTGMRSPEIVEVTSARLYVGNLSFDAVESDLSELFNGVGSVQGVELVMNRHTMRSKGFAFVQMQTVDEAKRAVTELHDKDYMGRKLVVSGAKAVEERRSERARQPEQ